MAAGDEAHLRRALALAERGRLTVRPNPMVGCVLVRDGEVVGEGWHERAGGPHAEIVALRRARERAQGATAYVTLEPCAHYGRTGPCADTLIHAGVARVVYALDDPNGRARGGAERLRAAGVEVSGGLLADEACHQNEAFVHVHRTGRPFVTLKLAQTLDGRVAARDGSSRWITSREARSAVHALRASVDAVMVGSGTVLADNPALTVRHVPTPPFQPRPVMLDARGRIPADAEAVRPGAIVVTTGRSEPKWRDALAGSGATVLVVAPAASGGVDLAATLQACAEHGVQAVLAEGGPTVAGALVRASLVDRLVLHLAPTLIGGDGLGSLAGAGAPSVAEGWRWRFDRVDRLGPDLVIVASPQPRLAAAPTLTETSTGRSG
ncbi:MAG: bifunctional diaminohydroxyphosphoribosylaminopyrimidine deaminase/5-amino-6-(5-phosphoribosylamino)uracil reductase RibD [Actinomycetota bacterium]|nr:bifunctional diaminohydroxyphosphoribosylaminopyrimidine deaminase/5-amino-6-(5-phosphoribosylamino)uracil reductase RibD [Actinomycetota bacterium]